MSEHHHRRRKAIVWAVLLSESSHVFCCVLPTIFSILSLMAGAGLVTVMPAFITDIHDTLHHYELPMIAASAVILCVGWALHLYSQKIDCHDMGCGHGPCAPKKSKTHMLLIVASVLFVLNVAVYTFFHRSTAFQERLISHDHESHDNDMHGHDADVGLGDIHDYE